MIHTRTAEDSSTLRAGLLAAIQSTPPGERTTYRHHDVTIEITRPSGDDDWPVADDSTVKIFAADRFALDRLAAEFAGRDVRGWDHLAEVVTEMQVAWREGVDAVRRYLDARILEAERAGATEAQTLAAPGVQSQVRELVSLGVPVAQVAANYGWDESAVQDVVNPLPTDIDA